MSEKFETFNPSPDLNQASSSSIESEKLDEQIIKEKLLDLKEIIKNPDTRPNVKELLQGAEVVSVICGLKPASYLQRISAKAFLSSEKFKISEKDFAQSEMILKKFGVNLSRDIQRAHPKVGIIDKFFDYMELFHIYNSENVTKAMKDSNLFTGQELTLAKENLGSFLADYLVASNLGYESTYRVGVILGYPLVDVKDFIEFTKLSKKYNSLDFDGILKNIHDSNGKLENTYGVETDDWNFLLQKVPAIQSVSVDGVKDGIQWKSSNRGNPSVERQIKDYERCFELQKQILEQ